MGQRARSLDKQIGVTIVLELILLHLFHVSLNHRSNYSEQAESLSVGDMG